jgi:serine/threonine-protein kinase
MTPQRHQQIKRLFLAAVELAPSEVQPFLDSVCGGDGELRSDVQSLLDHHRTETLLKAGEFFDTARPQATAVLSALEDELSLPTEEIASPPRPAGTMIAGRYRLVSPLGRGGMGVVYRAEDTELGQTIALKFLGPKLQEKPESIDLLRREVRIARQITHPNVVRIFDLGTSDGETFISMEFVAGEDLQSLVRRVGPLPGNKVLQIARQLAAGLAAAHEAGVLHRDLKPANVMIDGAGNVRILDFGIAAPLDDEQALRRLSGTPGFLAPELLAGQKPSQQSDLFAWGMVVYFAAAGRMPAADDLRGAGDRSDRNWLPGVSDDLAACVESCLQSNPALRPKTARSVWSSLGDPLNEALESGHMPSPELVSAALSWNPSAQMVDGLLGAGLVLLVLILLLADRTLFLTRCGLVKSPTALQEIAQQVLVDLGHAAPTESVLTGVTLDTDSLQYVRAHPQISTAWKKVTSGELPAVWFWYRQGDPRLPRPDLPNEANGRIPQLAPGAAFVRLDGRGKLLSLQVAADSPGDQPASTPVGWQRLFELAGLPWGEFREISATVPPLFADAVHSWEGMSPTDANQPVTVTAASLRGRIVYFEVTQPWAARPATAVGLERGRQSTRYLAVRTALWLVVISVAAGLAWRHVQQGHVDWRGAWRVTAVVLILGILDWLCGSRHTFAVSEELAAAFYWLNLIVFSGVIAGVAYLAVEPSARRWWPWSIVTIRRLLDGQLQDRAIWADALLGVVVGLLSVCLRQFCTLINQLFNVPVSGLNDFDPSQNLLDHFGLRYKVAVMISALLLAVIDSLLMLTLVVALKRATKSTPIAAVLVVLLLTALAIVGRGIISPVDWLARGLLLSIAAWLLLRHGLLATIAALATFYAINNAPLTLDWSKWHAATGFVVVATVTVVIVALWRFARPCRSHAA